MLRLLKFAVKIQKKFYQNLALVAIVDLLNYAADTLHFASKGDLEAQLPWEFTSERVIRNQAYSNIHL